MLGIAQCVHMHLHCTVILVSAVFTNGESSAGDARLAWQVYLPACEECTLANDSVTVEVMSELSTVTPSPEITGLPFSSSHCRLALLPIPKTVSLAMQMMLCPRPRSTLAVSLMETAIADSGTACRETTITEYQV